MSRKCLSLPIIHLIINTSSSILKTTTIANMQFSSPIISLFALSFGTAGAWNAAFYQGSGQCGRDNGVYNYAYYEGTDNDCHVIGSASECTSYENSARKPSH